LRQIQDLQAIQDFLVVVVVPVVLKESLAAAEAPE
jgi:hypothetical protein